MNLDPAIRTKFAPLEVAQAFARAHRRVFGIFPGPTLVRVLCAWSAFETDRWRSCLDANLCNMRGTYRGHATSFKASEIENGVEVFLPPSASNLFRAYVPDEARGLSALDCAAEELIRFVGTASNPEVRPNRFARAWDAACQGDLATFVDGLAHPTLPGIDHVPGFFTANPRVYLAGVTRHYDELADDLAGLEPYPEAS